MPIDVVHGYHQYTIIPKVLKVERRGGNISVVFFNKFRWHK
ncbi:hypothetical protein NliqN6_3171 [Naganishia liquefaciens]|uniref:Uncharacterized protein n=1 Tax=Naganishia liquefaciens TaxID=104408 RepID=A0A8H3YER8_9TREE|nr:hypothetical protein NliqN6_3171 [Naganishia liquefaciens]